MKIWWQSKETGKSPSEVVGLTKHASDFAVYTFDHLVWWVGRTVDSTVESYAKTPRTEGTKNTAAVYRKPEEIQELHRQIMQIGIPKDEKGNKR